MAGDREPASGPLRAGAGGVGHVHPLVRDNIWLFVPVQQKLTVGATAERLDVIDFKTDAPPRESAARSYPAYVAQVRAYGALLAATGAARERAMRTGLLFSADGSIHWV